MPGASPCACSSSSSSSNSNHNFRIPRRRVLEGKEEPQQRSTSSVLLLAAALAGAAALAAGTAQPGAAPFLGIPGAQAFAAPIHRDAPIHHHHRFIRRRRGGGAAGGRAMSSSSPSSSSSLAAAAAGGGAAAAEGGGGEATAPASAWMAPALESVAQIEVPPHFDSVRVHSISDIHVDYRKNLDWFRHWCSHLQLHKGKAFSILLIPGDIASSPATFRTTLEVAKASFDEAFIVAGNHDLWHSSSLQTEGVFHSLDKLGWIHRVAAEVGVRTGPARFATPEGKDLYVVPLLSWYHPSWDTEPDLPPEVLAKLYDGRPSFEQRWADFRCCRWPESVVGREDFVSVSTRSTALADLFARMNDRFLRSDPALAAPESRDRGKTVVISFSHFLPRQELCPEKRFLIEPSLTKVIGSAPLGRQVSALRPDLHVFGHTHIPIDLSLDDGVRYLQWPLGSVSEQSRQCTEMAHTGPLLLYDDARGGLQGKIATRWGEHYSEVARNPLQADLAPWVVAYWMPSSKRENNNSNSSSSNNRRR